MEHHIIVRCAYCKTNYGTKPCSPEMHLKISDGICEICEVKVNAELDKI